MVAAGPLKRLLIVDDEPEILAFVARVTRRHYQVTVETCPVRALARLAEDAFDGVVSDQKMPKLSGLELIAQARARQPALVTVLLSGFVDDTDVALALTRGLLDGHAQKPIDGHGLLTAIAAAFARRA